METAASPASSSAPAIVARIRNAAIAFLFALILLIPKILRIRRDGHSWLAFRILLGLAGAALVILPLAFWNSWLAAIAGLAMFLAAVLAPPALPETDIDAKSRELEALVVVNGGNFRPLTGPQVPVRLFVGADNISALDANLQQILNISVPQISSVAAEETSNVWRLQVGCHESVFEFLFTGIFAEHFARVAENSIRAVLHETLPIIPRKRAASAGA